MCACIVQKSWPTEGLMCHVSISITISDAIAYYLRKYMALWPAVLQRWRWWRRLHCRLRQLELYSFYCCVEILQLPLQISISIIQYYCSLFGCYCPIQFHRRRLWLSLSLSHVWVCKCVSVREWMMTQRQPQVRLLRKCMRARVATTNSTKIRRQPANAYIFFIFILLIVWILKNIVHA